MVKYSTSLDATFAALGDPTRRSILTTLQRGQASVTELSRPHAISMPAVMKHLRVLEDAGLVSQQKIGRVRMCRLAVAPLQQASDWLSLYRVFWENQLDSLENFLNQPEPEGEHQMSQATATPTAVTSSTAPPPALVINRTFAVPRDRVFRAWTKADQLARWFSPTDQYTVKADIDLRVGGAYRIEMHHSGGNINVVVGTYQVINAPEKLSFTWRWEGSPMPDSLVTIDFIPVGNNTEVVMTHEKLATIESRNKHEEGWIGCMTRLDRTLASEA